MGQITVTETYCDKCGRGVNDTETEGDYYGPFCGVEIVGKKKLDLCPNCQETLLRRLLKHLELDNLSGCKIVLEFEVSE